MCECGCGDFNPICKFKGPGKLTYLVQIYPGCQGCSTPAGIIIYGFTDEDIDEWNAHDVPEKEILYEGTAFPVIDQVRLKERMAELHGEDTDEAFACEEGIDMCFLEAVWDNIEEGQRILRESTSTANPKVLKWARRSAHINIEEAERALKYRQHLAILRMKENGSLPVSMYEVREMAKLYKLPVAAFDLPRVPFRWYLEWLGYPKKGFSVAESDSEGEKNEQHV